MTTRILPPDEWAKLEGTELAQVAPTLDRDEAAVVVVEDDAARVVGCWALLPLWHAECVWVAPEHRGKASVARRLMVATMQAARQRGARALWTGALTEDVERLLVKHLGAVPVPGKPFVFGIGA